MPTAEQAPPGRSEPVSVPEVHFVTGKPLRPGFPEGMQRAVFGMGCFWGAERGFWELPGVYTTAVGYAGGVPPNPTYQEGCTGLTGHTEVVLAVFDPALVAYDRLLRHFWEGHDPTQGMRQGNDVGTQYRSVIHCGDETQLRLAEVSKRTYQPVLQKAGYAEITTEAAWLLRARWYRGGVSGWVDGITSLGKQDGLITKPFGLWGLGSRGAVTAPERLPPPS